MKRYTNVLYLILLLGVLWPPLLAWGQTGAHRDLPSLSDQQALERWQRMTPEEKQDLRERYRRGDGG